MPAPVMGGPEGPDRQRLKDEPPPLRCGALIIFIVNRLNACSTSQTNICSCTALGAREIRHTRLVPSHTEFFWISLGTTSKRSAGRICQHANRSLTIKADIRFTDSGNPRREISAKHCNDENFCMLARCGSSCGIAPLALAVGDSKAIREFWCDETSGEIRPFLIGEGLCPGISRPKTVR